VSEPFPPLREDMDGASDESRPGVSLFIVGEACVDSMMELGEASLDLTSLSSRITVGRRTWGPLFVLTSSRTESRNIWASDSREDTEPGEPLEFDRRVSLTGVLDAGRAEAAGEAVDFGRGMPLRWVDRGVERGRGARLVLALGVYRA